MGATTPTDPTAALKLARDALAAIVGSAVRPTTPSDGAALNAARAALAAIDAMPAPSGEPAEFDHDIGADRFKVAKGPFWWHIRIGDSTGNVGKFHSKMAAEDVALKMLTAFRDGAYMQHQAMRPTPQAAPAPQAEPVPSLGALANAVIGAARRAMNDSFEAGGGDIAMPGHVAAALSLRLDEFDRAAAAPAVAAPVQPLTDDDIELMMLPWAKDEGPWHEYERNDLIGGVRAVLAAAATPAKG